MSERVTISIDNGVADVRMNRPDKLNALDAAQMQALVNAAEELEATAGLRAVVLSGNGRAFCSGLDSSMFTELAGLPPGHSEDAGNFPQRVAYQWALLPVPVICALHGYVFGGGLQIALGADIRIAHPDAQLSVLEIKWGIIPDMSGSQTLRDLVRLDVAKELAFTGRQVGGAEATELGLATRVSEQPLEDALALAAEIATKSPQAIRSAKTVLRDGRRGSIAEGLKREEQHQIKLLGSPNQIEAIMANMEKRAPKFVD